jgi:hypothetical protein
LDVELPASYKEFLRQFGWGGVGSIELFGLGMDVPDHLHLIKMAKSEREECEPNIPPHLIPLRNDGFGNHDCLDTRELYEGECPVVFWNHELDVDQIPERIADDFVSWLIDLLDFEKEDC